MDELGLILTALSAGAAVSGQEVVNEMAKDAYHKLIDTIKQRFAHKPKAQETLTDYQDDPEVYEKPLRKILAQEGLDHDQPVLQAAEHVVKLIQPQQMGMGKYNVQISGDVHGYAQGDRQTVHMNFGTEKKDQHS